MKLQLQQDEAHAHTTKFANYGYHAKAQHKLSIINTDTLNYNLFTLVQNIKHWDLVIIYTLKETLGCYNSGCIP